MGAPELQALLREIKNVRSPIQRLRLISLAWRTVRRLSSAERTELATHLGVEGFEGILQRLGRKGDGGIAPAEVLRALEEAQNLDPAKLSALLAGDAPAPPAIEEVPAVTLQPGPETTEAEPPPAETQVESPAMSASPERTADLVARIGSTSRLVARFRMLRRVLDEEVGLDLDGLRAVMACFPEGWPRRRALIAILRVGRPEKLDDAVSLIDSLERPTDRRWCIAALIASRVLRDDDAKRIRERFPFLTSVRSSHPPRGDATYSLPWKGAGACYDRSRR